MNCPKCNNTKFHAGERCSKCGFQGDATLVEELARVRWLLSESRGWRDIPVRGRDRRRIWQKYTARKRILEIELGLRLAPVSKSEAKDIWSLRIKKEALLGFLYQSVSYTHLRAHET